MGIPQLKAGPREAGSSFLILNPPPCFALRALASLENKLCQFPHEMKPTGKCPASRGCEEGTPLRLGPAALVPRRSSLFLRQNFLELSRIGSIVSGLA